MFINLYSWGVSKTTSLTDWHCCKKDEDDKARERTISYTHHIKSREGGPASSEEAQTNATETPGRVGLCWFLRGSALQGWTACLGFPTPPTALSPSGPSLWVRWDACVLLAWGTWLQLQNSPGWQTMPASLPGGWEHRHLGGGGRRGGGSWCQWHISRVAATAAAEKAPEPGNWIADNWERFLPCPVGPQTCMWASYQPGSTSCPLIKPEPTAHHFQQYPALCQGATCGLKSASVILYINNRHSTSCIMSNWKTIIASPDLLLTVNTLTWKYFFKSLNAVHVFSIYVFKLIKHICSEELLQLITETWI